MKRRKQSLSKEKYKNPPLACVTNDPKLFPAMQCQAGPYNASNSCINYVFQASKLNTQKKEGKKKSFENQRGKILGTFLRHIASCVGLGRLFLSGLASTRALARRIARSCIAGGMSADLSRTFKSTAIAASFSSFAGGGGALATGGRDEARWSLHCEKFLALSCLFLLPLSERSLSIH